MHQDDARRWVLHLGVSDGGAGPQHGQSAAAFKGTLTEGCIANSAVESQTQQIYDIPESGFSCYITMLGM